MVHVLWQYVDWHITRTMTIDLYMYYVYFTYFYRFISVVVPRQIYLYSCCFFCVRRRDSEYKVKCGILFLAQTYWFRGWCQDYFLSHFFFFFWCVTSALRLQLEQYKSIKVKLTSGNWYLSLRDRFRCEALGSLSGWLKYLMNT